MTVSELLEKIDSRELSEWSAFFKIEAKNQEIQKMEAKAEQSLQNAKNKMGANKK
jgi:hypothetical protein